MDELKDIEKQVMRLKRDVTELVEFIDDPSHSDAFKLKYLRERLWAMYTHEKGD